MSKGEVKFILLANLHTNSVKLLVRKCKKDKLNTVMKNTESFEDAIVCNPPKRHQMNMSTLKEKKESHFNIFMSREN